MELPESNKAIPAPVAGAVSDASPAGNIAPAPAHDKSSTPEQAAAAAAASKNKKKKKKKPAGAKADGEKSDAPAKLIVRGLF